MAKADYPHVKPVIVRWTDAMSTSGWCRGEDSDLACTTVGALLDKSTDRVKIALNSSAYGPGHVLEIPMSCVKSIKRLKE